MIHVLADSRRKKIRKSPSHPRLKGQGEGNVSQANSSIAIEKKDLDDSVEMGSLNDSLIDDNFEDKDINNSLILR